MFPLAAFMLGHSFIWCVLFGFLFGFYHFKNYTFKQSLVKAVLLSAGSYLLLPFGIEIWVLSHLLFDAVCGIVLIKVVQIDVSD